MELNGQEELDPMVRHTALTTTEWEEILGASESSLAIPETEAWAIATAWGNDLHSYAVQQVQLKTETITHDPFAVVESYEWIKFKAHSPSHAAVARAATLTWFWLSCCRGYSGRENPCFWKRVFADLQREMIQAGQDVARGGTPAVSDATRFFVHHEFPRVRLKLSAVGTLRAFFNASLNESATRRLRAVHAQLLPHIRPHRLLRQLSVLVEINDFPSVSSALRWLDSTKNVGLPEEPLLRVRIDSVMIHAWVRYLPHVRTVPLRGSRLAIKTMELTARDSSQSRAILDALFQINPSRTTPARARVQTLCLRRESLPGELLSSVCSGLPYSRSVSVLHILAPTPNVRYRSRNLACRIKDLTVRNFEASDWAWLGFALFHPDTKRSGWESLDINVDGISTDTVRVLERMAMGNNLATTGSSSPVDPHESYDAVQLQPNTTVYAFPDADAEVLRTIQASVYVDEWATPRSNAENYWGDWLQVVVPGRGLGYVQRSCVVARKSRRPASASLRGLRVHVSTQSQVPAALSFVTLVSTSLLRLDLANCGALDSIELHTLLFTIPTLKSLTVRHDTELWATPLGPPSTLPCLEELYIVLEGNTLHSPHPGVCKTVFRELHALRITALSNCFRKNHTAVVSYINALPKLNYFHWSDPETSSNARYHSYHADPHRQRRISTLNMLGEGVLTTRRARCRMAFLSVLRTIRLADPLSPIGKLHADVGALIFAFTPGSSKLDLCVG